MLKGEETESVTRNAQVLSVREKNKGRLRGVRERVQRKGWEVVCVTELRAQKSGIV